MTAFKTEGIPLLRQSDFSKSRSIALEENFTGVSLEAYIFQTYSHCVNV